MELPLESVKNKQYQRNPCENLKLIGLFIGMKVGYSK